MSTTSNTNALAKQLGANWYKSKDISLETSEDSSGYHIFVAKGATGFAWQPLVTLKPGDADAAAWTGYSCLTGSGDYVVSVVAPSDYTNVPTLRDQGGFAYVTAVATGATTAVTAGVAIKYYSPGCGAGDTVELTRNLGSDQAETQLIAVNAKSAAVGRIYTVAGQVTSAVPASGNTVLAARGAALVRFSGTATERTVAHAKGQIYDIAAAADGTATFLADDAGTAEVARMSSAGVITDLASGPATSTEIYSGRAGRPVIVAKSLSHLVPAADASVISRGLPAEVDGASLDGQVVVGQSNGKYGQVKLDVTATATGAALTAASALPAPAEATTTLPKNAFFVGEVAQHTVSISPNVSTGPTDPGCAIPRLSPTMQVPQPSREQVERAVDLAVTGQLDDTRPADFLNMGLVSYAASTDFPPHVLDGGGTVPAQVYLGILAQESNMAQASWHALPGIAGDPLIADYYGAAGSIDVIDYAASDCGYGIGQVTTGMDNNDNHVYSTHGQMKIAADYEENIAAGLQILQDKWNQLYTAGITANNTNPAYIENWYFAIWAYNTGIEPNAANGNSTGCTPSPTCTDGSGNWGLGWANNPANPDYPPGREGFLDQSYGDASHPGNWPYQERVFGWITHPQQAIPGNGDPSYATPGYGSDQPQYPWGDGDEHVGLNTPGETLFCNATSTGDSCVPDTEGVQGQCQLSNDHCWWHEPATWATDCSTQCATERLTYQPGSTEPTVTDPHPAQCDSGLPSSAVIVSVLADTADNVAGCTGMNWTDQGTFSLAYATDANGNPTGAIDTHQLDTGLGGYLYFAHNRTASDTANLVTGTWKASLAAQLYNVEIHTSTAGGATDNANYQIKTADNTVESSVVSQHTNENEWLSLGYYELGSNAQVTLNNITTDADDGAHDIAFDAIAFVPVTGTVVRHTFDAVSVINPDQSLDTNTPSSFDTPLRTMQTLYDWGVERTSGGPHWDGSSGTTTGLENFATCGGTYTSTCVGPTLKSAADQWGEQVAEAGDVSGGVGSLTPAQLMGFANPAPSPSETPGQAFASDLSYKLKTHVDVAWVQDSSGTIEPGSLYLSVDERLGSTHIAPFALSFMQAMQTDYGVTIPDLAFNEVNAHTYTNDATTIGNPLTTGYTPAQAFMPNTEAPQVDTVNNCMQIKSVDGGVDAYRPLDTESGATDGTVSAWVQQIQGLVSMGELPQEVADTAGDIYSMFFRAVTQTPPGGSLFNLAPPIWQQIGMEFCADGTLRPAQAVPDADDSPQYGLVYQGYMPDLYLYYDGKMVNQAGQSTQTAVQSGNFANFSNIPLLTSDAGNAYGYCNIEDRGNGGNPWDVSVPELTPTYVQPAYVINCDDLEGFSDTNP